MDWMKQLDGILDQYGTANPSRPPATVDQDYDRAVQAAPPAALSDGLAAAFRSDQTPEFPQMASQMFGRAPASQRAGILNALLATVGPLVLQQILARRQQSGGRPGGQGGGLGGMLDGLIRGGGGNAQVSPEVAQQVPAEVVEEVAREAEKKDPSIVDRISEVYAKQPELLKVLGGAALAIALGRMAQRKGTL